MQNSENIFVKSLLTIDKGKYFFKHAISLGMYLVFFLLVTIPTNAFADRIAEPGSVSVVERSTDKIEVISSTKGKAIVEEYPDGTNVLVYYAPEDIPKDPTEVKYKVSGEEKTENFSIRSGISTFGSPEVYNASLKALFILLVLAIVVESGLELIFKWRPYIQYFNSSGTNAVIAFVFSMSFVSFYEMDIATRLVNAYVGAEHAYGNSPTGYILTALIIAGGSAGVHKMFRSFGIRSIGPPKEEAGPVDSTVAWIAVALNRKDAVGTVSVFYGEKGSEAAIGTVSGDNSQNWFESMFMRNNGRFPKSGGHSVTVTDKPQVIKIEAHCADGKLIKTKEWGPYVVGSRAIVDVELEA